LDRHVKERYSEWDSAEGKAILAGKVSLAELADQVEKSNSDPKPRSGRQEFLENLVNSYL
jgi:xylose isomerase